MGFWQSRQSRNMALPYDAIAPEAGGLQARKMSRARAVGATMAIAMVACVALLGITGGMNRTELVIKTPAHTGLNMLANRVLREGGDMTVPQLAKRMQNWRPGPSPSAIGQIANMALSSEAQKLLAQGGAKTQMLSGTRPWVSGSTPNPLTAFASSRPRRPRRAPSL